MNDMPAAASPAPQGRAATSSEWVKVLSEIAAAMAGYEMKDLRPKWQDGTQEEADLRAMFVDRAMHALDALAPMPNADEPPEAADIPEDVRGRRDVHIVTALREWRGIEPAALAAKAGLAPSLVDAIEKREIVPNELHEVALAMALNVPVHDLTDWQQVAVDDAEFDDPDAIWIGKGDELL